MRGLLVIQNKDQCCGVFSSFLVFNTKAPICIKLCLCRWVGLNRHGNEMMY